MLGVDFLGFLDLFLIITIIKGLDLVSFLQIFQFDLFVHLSNRESTSATVHSFNVLYSLLGQVLEWSGVDVLIHERGTSE